MVGGGLRVVGDGGQITGMHVYGVIVRLEGRGCGWLRLPSGAPAFVCACHRLARQGQGVAGGAAGCRSVGRSAVPGGTGGVRAVGLRAVGGDG